MKYLKENEIEQIIVDYIMKEKNNYAILLDGDWGSGKTFFIKNKIIPKIYDETKKKMLEIIITRKYCPLLEKQDFKNVDFVIVKGADHQFTNNLKEFINLPETYLF